MGAILCKMNSVNGDNTGSVVRRGMGKSYPSAGYLLRKNTPGKKGEFYVESTDGGTNNYYRLIDPEKYGLSGVCYVWISSTYVSSPTAASIKADGAKSKPSNNQTTTQAPTVDNVTTEPVNSVSTFQYSQGLDDAIYRMLQGLSIGERVKSNTRVLGIPFQFTDIADNRPFAESNNLNYGRKYLENIVTEEPIVYFTPGLPEYMPDSDNETRDTIDAFIKQRSKTNEISDEVLSKVLNTDLRYYSFTSAYVDYMRYVNMLCRASALYMGLGSSIVPGTTTRYDKYDWGKWTNFSYTSSESTSNGIFSALDAVSERIKDDIFGEYKYVKFYVDPSSSSFSESGSNNTQASQVAGLFDTLEGIVKEIGFFSNGGGILSSATDLLSSGAAGAGNSLTTVLDPDTSVGLSKIIKNGAHVLQGSNVIFPELWGDSSYSKSYSFNINLISPYGDPESVYLNIIVPMMHILAMSMPRQTSANSFGSPFLVKAFAQGWFSCDLGIIESVSIEKDTSSLNVYGLPNEVRISINIRDLYPNLMISKSSTPNLFFANQGLIEFLAVTAGVNITEGNLALKIKSIISAFTNTLFDIPSDVYDSIMQGIRNTVGPWFKLTNS